MTETSFSAYGVRVLNDDGEPIDLADLSPLMMPTPTLLRLIAEAGGPHITPEAVRKSEHNLPLASIDGTPILCSFLCEETDDPIETQQLVKARRLELARLFTGLMQSSSPPSARYFDNAVAIRAIFILFAAFDTAQCLVKSARERRVLNGYTFEATHLHVTERSGKLHFEHRDGMAPASAPRVTVH